MQTPEFRLEITFAPDAPTLRRVVKDGNSVERIPLPKPVMPEGPGSTVFLASLPLKEGFTTEFLVLDRWDDVAFFLEKLGAAQREDGYKRQRFQREGKTVNRIDEDATVLRLKT